MYGMRTVIDFKDSLILGDRWLGGGQSRSDRPRIASGCRNSIIEGSMSGCGPLATFEYFLALTGLIGYLSDA